MNFLQRIFNRLTGYGNQPTTSRIVYTGRTAAGVYIDADTALKNATVWACVQYLTRTVGQLPWRVMRETRKGNEIAGSHPLDWLLHKRPCPDMGAFSWRQAMLGNALLHGNAYAEIQRDQRGVAIALWPIHPERVCPRRAESGALEYEVWNSGGNVVLSAEDMFHIRGFGDGPVGYGVVEYAAQSIGWAQATELFGASFFGDGMKPSGVVEIEHSLSPEGLLALKSEMKKLYAGPKGERTVFLDNKMKFTPVAMQPDNAQFIETRQHQVEEICRWFGVPPHKVQHLLRSTFSNIEHQAIEVVVDSVTPWVRVFEEEADYKLFGSGNRQNFYTKMSLQALLRGDNASRMQFYKGLFELGVPINEILSYEDMNGIGADGDVSFVSNNVQPIRRAIEGEAKQAADTTGDNELPMTAGADNGRGLPN